MEQHAGRRHRELQLLLQLLGLEAPELEQLVGGGAERQLVQVVDGDASDGAAVSCGTRRKEGGRNEGKKGRGRYVFLAPPFHISPPFFLNYSFFYLPLSLSDNCSLVYSYTNRSIYFYCYYLFMLYLQLTHKHRH